MSASLGRITARLVHPDEETYSQDLVDLINENIKPPTPVNKEDVYIGAMYVVSDEVNSFGGRFPPEEHERLAHLLVDSPVMVGHRKDKLPIGRNFHAAVVERDGKSWVKSYFYWLKSTDGAESLRENIEGGIYKECSIGFTFLFPECSLCGKDIRTCPHEPFQRYVTEDDDKGDPVTFNYRQIERVLETSLVYRGALPDTSVSKELELSESTKADGSGNRASEVTCISSLSELDSEKEYLVVPFYESLPVMVSCERKMLTLHRQSGEQIDQQICVRFPVQHLPKIDQAYGHLVGYRGKERCPVEQLEKHLAGLSSPVTRLEIKLFPPAGLALPKKLGNGAPNKIRPIRHCITRAHNINHTARSIMTRRGVRLWPIDMHPWQSAGYQYCPSHSGSIKDRHYSLVHSNGAAAAVMTFNEGEHRHGFEIKQFHLVRLLRGGRFIADRLEEERVHGLTLDKSTARGQIIDLAAREDGYVLETVGPLTGRFILRPVRLDGQQRYLFYRLVS